MTSRIRYIRLRPYVGLNKPNRFHIQPIVFFTNGSSLVCSGILLSKTHILTATECSRSLANATRLTFKMSKLDFHIERFSQESNNGMTVFKIMHPIEIGTHLLPTLAKTLGCSKRYITYTFNQQTDNEYATDYMSCIKTCSKKPACDVCADDHQHIMWKHITYFNCFVENFIGPTYWNACVLFVVQLRTVRHHR